jgi:hypothetical protein
VRKTPDGFLNLREFPKEGSPIVGRVVPGDLLYITLGGGEKQGWTRVNAKWIKPLPRSRPGSHRSTHGWAAERFLDFVECDDAELEREFATSAWAAPAKIRLPEHFRGLWCYYSSWEGGVSYLRNDASKPGTPCKKDGPTEWIVIGPDSSYNGLNWGCKVVRVAIIFRGDVVKGEPGANAIYGVDARCKGKGDTPWRERARIEAERWGSALDVMRRRQ